jgi:hypothetical protein
MHLSEQDCLELLPWFLNGTLSDSEKQAVSEQLKQSSMLQEELNQLTLLQQNLPKEEQEFPASTLGWKRLHKQIQNEQNAQSDGPQVNTEAAPKSNSWFKPVAIAATFILSVQVGLYSLNNTQDGIENRSDIQLLSGTPVVVSAHQTLLQLSLSDDATWQQISQLLNSLNADLVQGPSAIGLIHIRFSVDQVNLNGQAAASSQDVIDWLQAQAIVEHVALEP